MVKSHHSRPRRSSRARDTTSQRKSGTAKRRSKATVTSSMASNRMNTDKSEERLLQMEQKSEIMVKNKGYRILDLIGEGGYGKVYRADHDGELVAVKVMEMNKMSENYKKKFLPREISALMESHNEFIVEIFHILRSNRRIYIFMEYMPGGNVAQYMLKYRQVRQRLGAIWFMEIATGLCYLHDQAFISHRDIKLDNMLLTESNIAKLSDFGFARKVVAENGKTVLQSQTYCGTRPYQSPQIIVGRPYDPFKADVWAMGVSFYILFEFKFPFNFLDKKQAVSQANKWPDFILSRFSEKTPSAARRLIISMLNPMESVRPPIRDVLTDPWLNHFVFGSGIRNETGLEVCSRLSSI